MLTIVVIFIIPKNSRLGEECKKIVLKLGYSECKIERGYRGEDIPELINDLVEKDEDVLGLTGEDLFLEYMLGRNSGLKVLNEFYWNRDEFLYKEPTLCLLGPCEKRLSDFFEKKLCDSTLRFAINKKYKNLSEELCLKYFEAKEFSIERIYMNGNTEGRYSRGLTDLVIDIICSGKSSKRCRLTDYARLFSSRIVLIGRNKTNKNAGVLLKE